MCLVSPVLILLCACYLCWVDCPHLYPGHTLECQSALYQFDVDTCSDVGYASVTQTVYYKCC